MKTFRKLLLFAALQIQAGNIYSAERLSYAKFLRATQSASYKEYVAASQQLTRKDFDEMKAYVLRYYKGVKVERSFEEGAGAVFDCVVTSTQPALRHQPNNAVAVPPPPAPPGVQRFMAASTCSAGTIPLRRVTLGALVRAGSLQGFFQKSEGESVPRPK